MKKIYSILFVAIIVLSGSIMGQDFTNVRVNHITAGEQNNGGGNSIAVSGSNVYLLWQDFAGTDFSYVSKSTNGGVTFNDGVKVGGNDQQVFGAITTDNVGSVYVVWHDVNDTWSMSEGTYFAKSIDEATTFSTPLTISSTGFSAQIAVHGSNVYIFFLDWKADNKFGFFFARSTNGGTSFEAPYEITDATIDDFTFDSPTAMYVDNSGNIYCVWNDGRRVGTGTDIYFAKSTNNDVSFGANIMVNDIAGDPNKIRSGSTIAATGSNVYVAWRQEDGDGSNRKILFGKSTNGGTSFSAEKEIVAGGNSPSLTVNSAGEIYIAYPNFTGGKNGLFCTKSNNQGSSFPVTVFISATNTNAKDPSICVDGNDILYAVWTVGLEGNEDDVYFAKGKVQTATAPAAGDGTSGNPYQIASLENLCWIVSADAVVPSPTRAERWSRHYIQSANIDASASWTWNSGLGWARIGIFTSSPFTGSYNGQNNKITGLNINRPTSNGFGLFGYIFNATVKNLGVEGVNITGRDYVGALVGWNDYSLVENCYSTGSVSGNNTVGGLIGGTGSTGGSTTVKNSYSSCSISGTSNTGGLVGLAWSSTSIENSYSTGSVTGTSNTGGLVGQNNSSSTISNSYSTGSVSGTSNVGGLLGHNNASSTIRECYSTGSVSGTDYVGGLVGENHTNTKVSNSYSRGNVTRSSGTNTNFGGFIAHNIGTVEYCYSIDSVLYTGGVNPTDKGFAGLWNPAQIFTNNFWDSEASNQSTALGATAKTTAEMKTNTTFLNAGWDYNIWNIGDGINDGYPYLKWQNPGGTPLPVELTSFTANYIDGKVLLNWQTATEVDNYGFEVERKVGSPQSVVTGWKKIGFVQGHGNSNSPKDYSFTDNLNLNPTPTRNFKYRLKQIDNNGKFEYSDIVEVEVNQIPTEFALYQNYPNPFNPSTVIKWQSPVASWQTLKVYDVLGSEVVTLVDEFRPAGSYEVEFDASRLSSGVYFYKLLSGNYSETKKMILLR